MSWVLMGQLSLLLLFVYILVITGHSAIVDKRREDAHHRKDNGL